MNRTGTLTPAWNQTAMTTRILRVILNQNAVCNGAPDLLRRYHPFRPKHLPDCMGQVKHFAAGRRTYALQNITWI